jgi:hypothetical protein
MPAGIIIAFQPDIFQQPIDLRHAAFIHPDDELGERFAVRVQGDGRAPVIGEPNSGDLRGVEVAQQFRHTIRDERGGKLRRLFHAARCRK